MGVSTREATGEVTGQVEGWVTGVLLLSELRKGNSYNVRSPL